MTCRQVPLLVPGSEKGFQGPLEGWEGTGSLGWEGTGSLEWVQRNWLFGTEGWEGTGSLERDRLFLWKVGKGQAPWGAICWGGADG
jgi:hypothetical protein